MNIPNLISLLRMGLIPLFVIAVLQGEPRRALFIFIIAGLTDALDGFLARVLHQMSVLGTYLDPIADKLLLTTAFLILAIPGAHPGLLIPMWVTVLVIARDVLILVVALVLYLAVGVSRFLPTWLSKVNTAVQIVAVVLVLATGFEPGLEPLALFAIYAVAGLTLLSGLDYIYRASRTKVEEEGATA